MPFSNTGIVPKVNASHNLLTHTLALFVFGGYLQFTVVAYRKVS